MPGGRDDIADVVLARELARSEQNLRTLIEHTHVGLLVHRFGPIAYVNPSLVATLGYRDAQQLIGRHFWSVFHGTDLAGRFVSPTAEPEAVVARLAGVDGRITWAEVRGVPIDYDGAPAMLLLLRDMSSERRARAGLREREGRIWSLFAESPVALWEGDFSAALAHLEAASSGGSDKITDGALAGAIRKVRFIAINEATLALFEGRTPDELLRGVPKVFAESTLFRDLFTAMRAKATTWQGEVRARTLLGTAKHLNIRLNVLPGHEERWGRVVIAMIDLTEHRDRDAIVQAALREKEVMLREINHRIKNNLQVISSLLSLQSQHVTDPTTRLAFSESQNRVHAIALVHDQLYQSQNLARVNLGNYLKQLVGGLLRIHDAHGRNITPVFDVGTVELPVDIAIPCGLLVNELVTNALRHAFPEAPHGTITVRLQERDRRVTLQVADDGIGLPTEIDPENTRTLGLALVATFVEQLDATVQLARVGGTSFTFVFEIPAKV